jgi:hypothetical protein
MFSKGDGFPLQNEAFFHHAPPATSRRPQGRGRTIGITAPGSGFSGPIVFLVRSAPIGEAAFRACSSRCYGPFEPSSHYFFVMRFLS